MTRKKGIYDILFFKTKESPEKIITGANWKQILENLTQNYKDFINVKDLEHTTVPFIKVVTTDSVPATSKEKEEYFYTKRK